jgi:hypothetical protein
MRIPISAILILAICSLSSAAELPDSVLQAIEARLRSEAPSVKAVVVSEQSCSSIGTNSPYGTPRFLSHNPQGFFIACDCRVKGNKAAVTVLHYLIVGANRKVLANKIIHTKLSMRNGVWHVTAWSATALDYAPG